jgi:glycosyltransferase involved in cell wall biosynthesis
MSNRRKALVIVTPGFPSSEADSTCLPMQQQFVRSLQEGYPDLDVFVLSLQYPYHSKTYKWFDATVTCFNGRNKGGIARLVLREKVFATLKTIKSSNDVIGLLSFWYGECAYIGRKFGNKHGITHRCWLLGQDARKDNKYPARLRADKNELVALSDFLRDEFEKNHGIRPTLVIPPGNDTLQPAASTLPKNIDILAAGSLIPLKRFDLFLEVIANVRKTFPVPKCILVGEGPEKEKLEKMIEDLGLQDCVRLTGQLPHNAVLELMQKVKVFLHPSCYEGFSGVCLEALSMGAHVISFTKPMHHDINQWHVVRSENDMIRKTAEILQDANTTYEKQIVFRMHDTTRNMMELYL